MECLSRWRQSRRKRPASRLVKPTAFKIGSNSACEPDVAETTGSVIRTLCPVFWSKMRYSPGEDVASFSILTLAATRLSAASRQSTSPVKSILKTSKEGTMWLLASQFGGTLVYSNFVTTQSVLKSTLSPAHNPNPFSVVDKSWLTPPKNLLLVPISRLHCGTAAPCAEMLPWTPANPVNIALIVSRSPSRPSPPRRRNSCAAFPRSMSCSRAPAWPLLPIASIAICWLRCCATCSPSCAPKLPARNRSPSRLWMSPRSKS